MVSDYETKAAETLAKLMEKLAENGDAVIRAVDKLIYLENSGTLDELLNLAEIAVGFKKLPEEFLDKELREVVSKNIELLLSLALSVDDETIKMVEKLLEALKKAKDFSPAGLTGMLKAMRDPDVQRAFGFFLTFAKSFGSKI